jgi:hypothetical protein
MWPRSFPAPPNRDEGLLKAGWKSSQTVPHLQRAPAALPRVFRTLPLPQVDHIELAWEDIHILLVSVAEVIASAFHDLRLSGIWAAFSLERGP